MRLEDQLEAAPDLLLADGGHGNDLFERPWYPLLSASDVKTSSSDGIIGTALQAFSKKRSSSLCNMTNVILRKLVFLDAHKAKSAVAMELGLRHKKGQNGRVMVGFE